MFGKSGGDLNKARHFSAKCLLATEGQISFITYSHIRQKIKTSTSRDDLFRQK